ncbi:exported hypothetical protein [Candidatus Sulfotelmatomonas gaucii]|uniref:Uncharacterized protein n=1 Tax=Candidatus Sulfuritelmatomonas gaucii TaxID=2043161 RepID=A0A2N9M400_9BACT|nr:exported hypothetical protein [Candidatus Sulfotelmatomonas gaucii]
MRSRPKIIFASSPPFFGFVAFGVTDFGQKVSSSPLHLPRNTEKGFILIGSARCPDDCEG